MLILTGVVLLSCCTITTSQVAPPVADKFVNNQLDAGVKAPSRGPPSAAPPNLATLLSLNSQPDNKVLRQPIQDITRNVTNTVFTKENNTSMASSSSTTNAPSITEKTTVAQPVSSITKEQVTTIAPSIEKTPITTEATSTAAPTTTGITSPATVSTTKKPTSTTSAPSTTTKAPTTTVLESSSSEESSEEVTTSTKSATNKPNTSTTPAALTSSTTIPTSVKNTESPFAEPDLEGEGTQEFKTNKVEVEEKENKFMSFSSKFEQKPSKKQAQEDMSGSSEVFNRLSVAQELSLLKKIAFNPAIGANAFGVNTLKSEDEHAQIHNIDGSNPSLPPFAFSEDAESDAKVEDISTNNFEKLISDITKTMMANIPTAAVSNGTQEEKVTVAKIREEPIKEKIIEFSRVDEEEKKEVEVVKIKESIKTEALKEVLKDEKQPEPKKEAKIGFVPVNINGDVFSRKEVNNNKKIELQEKEKTSFISSTDSLNFHEIEAPSEILKSEKQPEPKKPEEAKIGIVPVNINGDVFSRKETNNNKKIELQQKKKTVFSSAPDSFNTGKNFVPVRLFFDKTNDQTSIIKRKKNTKRRRVTPVPKRLNSHIVDGSFGSSDLETTTLPPTAATVTPTQPFGIQTEEVPIVEMVTPTIRTTQKPSNGRRTKSKVDRSRGLSKSTELLDHFESSSIGPAIRTDDFLIARPENVPIAPISDRELLQKRFEELETKETKKGKREEKKVKTPKEMVLPNLVSMPDLRVLNTFSTLRGPAHITGQSNKVVNRSNEGDIDWKKTYGYKGKRKVIRVRKLKKKNIDGDIKQDKPVIGQKVDSKQVQHGKYYGKWGKAKIKPKFIKKKLTTTIAPPTTNSPLPPRPVFNPLQPVQPASQPQIFQNQFQGGFAAPVKNPAPGFNFFAPAVNNAPMQLPASFQPQTQFQNRQLFNTPPVFNQAPQMPQARLFNTPPQQQQQQRQQQTFNSAPQPQGQVQGLAPVAKNTVTPVASRQIPQYLAADGRWYPYINNQPTLPQQVQPVINAPQQRSTMRPLVAEQVAQMVSQPRPNVPSVPTVKRSRSATISSESRKLKRSRHARRHRRGHKKLKKRSQHAKARSGGKTVKIHRVAKTHMGEVDKDNKGASSFSSNSDDRPVLVDRDHARKTIDRDVRRK